VSLRKVTAVRDVEPKGTLGVAATGTVGAVNGPEGDVLDWHAIDWRVVEDAVRRLRQRIFAASRVGDLKKVRNLQKLMLRSRANTLLSVCRVTEVNKGRKTAGVDGQIARTAADKAELAWWVQHRSRLWQARPVKRVWIPKSNGKRRGLGIPVLADRCLQAVTANALEPEWEARFEARSYGFRPGRSCQDAIAAIFWTVAGRRTKRRWVLDADLTAAFDRVGHAHILGQLGGFPAKAAVAGWLKAGVVDQGRYAPTEEGTPQGGVISPLLFNIALHGMETAAGAAYRWDPYRETFAAVTGTPVLVRYADDLVALCDSRDQAEQVKARLTPWLADRGLAFNEAKTRVVGLDEGFDFLSFNVRRYHDKLLIKPSATAVLRVRRRLAAEVRALRGANAAAVIHTLSPIVRGWAAYYRGAVSTEAFQKLDHYVWTILWKWALFRHPNKPKRWVVDRYFGQFHPTRRDRWVFGNRDSGAYLYQFAWTKIVRHDMVKGAASPDDPALAEYWATRRRRSTPSPINRTLLRQLRRQQGRCPICTRLLLHADRQPHSPQEWEQWLRTVRKAITKKAVVHTGQGPTNEVEQHLLHTDCWDRIRRRQQPSYTSARP
jgi:RNA-directed DNA polymerase